MNEKVEIKEEELENYKAIICDNGNIFDKRKQLISDVVAGKLTFSSSAFSKAIQELTLLQKTTTSMDNIFEVSDVKSQENFGDFISFTQDGSDYYVVGDLHADLYSFCQILEAINFKEEFDNIKLIFLGDYIDRGKDKLELINRIILLKYLLPANIYLLRGNHELYVLDENNNYISPMMNADASYFFNFLTLLATTQQYKSYGVTRDFIKLYADFFDSMPTIALFNFEHIKVCAMHGGLPRVDLNSVDYYSSDGYESFNRLLSDSTKDSVGIRQKLNILWSDPYDGYKEAYRDNSEVRFSYSQHQFIAFCKKYNIDLVLRAHEHQNNGYKSYFNNRLISVFSSGGKNINEFETVNQKSYYSNVSPNILKLNNTNLESININFTTEEIASIEETFEYVDIKTEREYQEENYILFQPKQVLYNNFLQTDGIIKIIDGYNNSNQKLIFHNSEIVVFNHFALEQFYGVNKDLKFCINPNTRELTNLCNIPLNVGIDCITLKQNEIVKVQDCTLWLDNTCTLLIVF